MLGVHLIVQEMSRVRARAGARQNLLGKPGGRPGPGGSVRRSEPSGSRAPVLVGERGGERSAA